MSDLIDRDQLIAALLDPSSNGRSLTDVVREQPAIKPQVVANITGGVLQGASADYPVDVYVLDFETDGASDDELIDVDGSEAILGLCSALIKPDFVRSVVEAPSLADD